MDQPQQWTAKTLEIAPAPEKTEIPATQGRLRRLAGRAEIRDWQIAALIALAFVALRAPFRAGYLINWDSVNFALALQHFDVLHHQPHPPGYIGYVGLGRALMAFTGDANAALTLLSTLSGGIATAALYGLARSFLPRWHALAVAVLFGTSPVLWYYSSVALTYAVEAAVAIPALWACYVARKRVSLGHLAVATFLLALLGALRQSGLVLLVPIWLYTLWAFPWQTRARIFAAFVALNTAWLVPLLVSSGGLDAYVRESMALASLVGFRTYIFTMDPTGLIQNMGLVAVGLAIGMNVGLVVWVICLIAGVRPAPLSREDSRFFLLWAIPSLATYLLVHTGQVGYVLMVLPIGFIWLGRMLAGERLQPVAARRLIPNSATLGVLAPIPRLSNAGAGAIALLVVANIVSFGRLQAMSLPGNDEAIKEAVYVAAGDGFVEDWRLRQYNARASDLHWKSMTEFIGRYPAESTVVLTMPTLSGSFRQASYYLPRYGVYGVGWDLQGQWGHLYAASGGRTDYNLQNLERGSGELQLGSRVTRVIIPDFEVYDRLDPRITGYLHTIADGSEVAVVDLPEPGATLLFEPWGQVTLSLPHELLE
ncbi:MAG: hypothetical protein FJ319_02010 [SAR202 cluster bacterium]|nr:hypothetical protein [SAR202 cluster bacterium]